jgi:large subunit ribosomal protein L23
MNTERLMKVILGPVISEKATLVADRNRQIVFEVVADATKAEVKAAVELMFKDQKVEVANVNVLNVKGKAKRHGRFEGHRRNVRKAYVSLKGEGDINFMEGVA